MKYELPSIELIVIEENDYLKFGEYLNDMQCDDTVNKLNLDDLEYVKKLQQENKLLKEVIDKAIEYINHFSKESEVKIYGLPKCKVFIGDIEQLLDILKEVE